MMLSTPDREKMTMLSEDFRASVQAAAYSVYVQIAPHNKKLMTPREFYKEFADNWETFIKIELEELSGD